MSQKQPEPRMIAEIHPNPTFRSYHVNREISNAYIESFCRPIRPSSKDHLDKVGPMGRLLVETILAMPGVRQVTIQPYKLSIEIGEAFSWEDTDPRITKAIKRIVWKRKASLVVITTKHSEQSQMTQEDEDLDSIPSSLYGL